MPPPSLTLPYLSLAFFNYFLHKSLHAFFPPTFSHFLNMNAAVFAHDGSNSSTSRLPNAASQLPNAFPFNSHHVSTKESDPAQALQSQEIRYLRNLLDAQEDARQRSACQTAAGRALWSHVIHDPLAQFLAGESCLRNLQTKMERDRMNNATEIAGVMLAVRTLWFDSKLEVALNETGIGCGTQVVILGAGMDARAYRLKCLEACTVFEMDLPNVLELKNALIHAVANAGISKPKLLANRLERVAADISSNDWFEKLKNAGYHPQEKTVWIMEGILYYLHEPHAKAVLSCISKNCERGTVLLADFMNEHSTHLAHELQTAFYFHSDWPEELLPKLGYTQVQVSQIGDADANFGLITDPLNFFNKLRTVPRYCKSDTDGKPCRRLFLVESKVA